MNKTLYRRELKKSWRLLVIFAAVLTMYIVMIVSMYDPKMAQAIDKFQELMPELMAAVGMTGNSDSLPGFLVTYLYGMILLVFPMVYTIIRANGLVAGYVERGSMACLLAAPVRRTTVACTQLLVLLTGEVLLLGYCTALEYAAAELMFPGELELSCLLGLNLGLLCLQLLIAGICFFFSCLWSDTRYSLAFGAGIPVVMYVLQMLSNMGGKLEGIRYATFFSLFRPQDWIDGSSAAWWGALALAVGAALLYAGGIAVFARKDLQL